MTPPWWERVICGKTIFKGVGSDPWGHHAKLLGHSYRDFQSRPTQSGLRTRKEEIMLESWPEIAQRLKSPNTNALVKGLAERTLSIFGEAASEISKIRHRDEDSDQ